MDRGVGGSGGRGGEVGGEGGWWGKKEEIKRTRGKGGEHVGDRMGGGDAGGEGIR